MKYILYHIPKTGGQTITNSFGDLFIEILDSFFYVGVTKNISRDLPVMANKMGLESFAVKSKNVRDERRAVHYILSETDREILNKENSLDFDIWQYACSRSNEFSYNYLENEY